MRFISIEPIANGCDYCPKVTAEYTCDGEKFCTSCMYSLLSEDNDRRMTEMVCREEDRKHAALLFGGSYGIKHVLTRGC